jgi:putative membrane protein (TIGR04086 family)
MEKKANVENSMQKKGLWILKSLLCAYLVTGVLLLILTVLLYKCGLEEKHVSAGILTVYILSTLAGKMARVRKFVWGLGIGVLYFLLLVLISFGIYHSIQEPFPQLLIVCILCTGGGMIGGMIS